MIQKQYTVFFWISCIILIGGVIRRQYKRYRTRGESREDALMRVIALLVLETVLVGTTIAVILIG